MEKAATSPRVSAPRSQADASTKVFEARRTGHSVNNSNDPAPARHLLATAQPPTAKLLVLRINKRRDQTNGKSSHLTREGDRYNIDAYILSSAI